MTDRACDSPRSLVDPWPRPGQDPICEECSRPASEHIATYRVALVDGIQRTHTTVWARDEQEARAEAVRDLPAGIAAADVEEVYGS